MAGREFLSVRATQGGEEIHLVEGTRIALSFDVGRIGVQAGCNILGGTYRLEGDTLVTDQLSMTEMGCDPLLHAQDQWLGEFFGGGPSIQLAGNDLLLSVGDRSVLLLDREIADPDLPLVDTDWTVDSLFSARSVSSVPLGAAATFRFTEDGRVDIDTGCNTGGGRYALGEEAGTIRFRDLVFTRKACTGAAGELEAQVLQVLAARTLDLSIEARVLELLAGPIGLGLRGS